MCALARAGRALTLGFLALIGVEHLVFRHLGAEHYMISEYATAGGVGGALGTTAFFVWACSFVAVAALAALDRELGVAVALGIAAVGIGLAGIFQTQAVRGVVPPGVELTTAGRLHDLGGAVAYLAVFAAVSIGIWRLGTIRFRVASAIGLIAAAIIGPVLTAADAGSRGARQRALVVAVSAWELAVISTLGRGGPRRERRAP